MNILLIDDDTNFIEKLKDDLWKFFYDYEDKTYFSIYSKMDDNIQFLDYQLAFLDIDLSCEKYTGIDIAEYIRMINPSCYIVFVSAKNHLIHSTLKVHPFFFIRKSNYSIDLDVFFKIFKDKIKKNVVIQLEYLSEQHIINIDDIIYIKATNHKSIVHTKKGNFYDNRTLKSFSKILTYEKYVQIHRSVIINMDFLLKRTNTSVILLLYENETIELIIGRTYKNNFNQAYKEMLLR